MAQYSIDAASSGQRLDVFSQNTAGITRSAAQRLIDNGDITVGGLPSVKNYRLREGDIVEITLPEPEPYDILPQDIPLDILYEDGDLIVVNKPRGTVVHPAAGICKDTLVNALLFHCGGSLSGIGGVARPGIVHRIDKNTSGLLVVAKNDFTHSSLSGQFSVHSSEREYRAIVNGRFSEKEGSIDAPIFRHPKDRKKMAVVTGGREAKTDYSVIEEFDAPFSYLSLRLYTGRTHQIRVHMSYRGHPLFCDGIYGGGKSAIEKRCALDGQCLHAKTLGFTHPRSGERMRFDSPLPEYFTDILDILRKTSH